MYGHHTSLLSVTMVMGFSLVNLSYDSGNFHSVSHDGETMDFRCQDN